jgi:hypothetical protein
MADKPDDRRDKPTDPPMHASPEGSGKEGKIPTSGQPLKGQEAQETLHRVGDTVVLADGTRCRIEAVKPDGRYGCITEDFKRAFDATADELRRPMERRRRRRGEPGTEGPQAPDQTQGGQVATPGVAGEAPASTLPVQPGQTDDPRFTARGGPVEMPQASTTGRTPVDPAHRDEPKVALPTPEALARAQQEEAQPEQFRKEAQPEQFSEAPRGGGAPKEGQPAHGAGQPAGTGGPPQQGQAPHAPADEHGKGSKDSKESPPKEDDKWQPPSKGQRPKK